VIRGGAQSSVTVDFPTDVIIDQSLYPAPHGQTAPQPEPSTPTGDAPPAARPWPQGAAPGLDQPGSTSGAVPEAAEPATDDSPPAADQSQQTSQNDEPSMVRYPVNSVSRTVIRPGTVSGTMRPLLFPPRTSSPPRSPRNLYPADFRSHPLRTASPARPASFATTRSRFVAMPDRPESTQTAPFPRNPVQKNGRQLPLLPSGPQGLAGQSGMLRSGSAPAQQAKGSHRPVLLAAAGPASAVVGRPRTRTEAGSRSWSIALKSTVAAPPSLPDLPLLKSGPQD
jgi:hypothetical protein